MTDSDSPPDERSSSSDTSKRAPISRRAALATLGGAGAAALLVACGTSSSSGSTASAAASSAHPPSPATSATSSKQSTIKCAALTQEQEQGPYYYPAAHFRSDITDGQHGVPLKLQLTVMNVNTCQPVRNAAVDIWEADALGTYSDSSSGLYLRGVQMTDADGLATFTSIYPGWYPGRTNHVHVKVHEGGSGATTYTGGHVSHTGNLFFPEPISTTVAKISPYTNNTATRVVLTNDFVYTGQHGDGSILKLSPVDTSVAARGYVASIILGINPKATPTPIGISGTVT